MKKAQIVIVASAATALIDAILKSVAIKRFPEEGTRFDLPIALGLHKNPGIAFDIPIPLSVVVLLTILIASLLAHFAYSHRKRNPAAAASAVMVVIGAVGNMIDRIVNGFTTDYIILVNRSAINLSDILIILGIILLLRYSESKEHR